MSQDDDRYWKMRKQVKLAQDQTYTQYFDNLLRELAAFIDDKVPDGVDIEVTCDDNHWRLRVSYSAKHESRSTGISYQRKKFDFCKE